MHDIRSYKPDGDKIMRMNSQTGTIESGFVHLPNEAPWLADYLHELSTFPRSAYDDQVDSTAQFLDWCRQGISGEDVLAYFKAILQPASTPGSPAEATVRMRAPAAFQNYYVSGGDGRAGRYTADGSGIIVQVHPEDVEPLRRFGCTRD
jgi:hypothetical protein